MFENLTMAPPDPILGLTDAFKKDSNPNKINLGVGVYKDENGATPILETVKKAESMLLINEKTKDYLSIAGAPDYALAVQELLFAKNSPILAAKRAVTAHTPGGTGALRIAADFLKKFAPDARVWFSAPTWPNHDNIFRAAGFEIAEYPYYNPEARSLDFSEMMECLRSRIPEGDIVLLHGCCHNPTGIDPTPEQWNQIADIVAKRGLIPVIDLAYLGLAKGIEEDASGMRQICANVPAALIASSFSKNFGLYNERVGALTVVLPDANTAEKAFSHVKAIIRANYSNPPSHGAAIVSCIMSDPALRAQWVGEVAAIRTRIHEMRTLFVQTLKAKGVTHDFSFIARQNGMFSFSGLTKDQVEKLKAEFSIYIVGSGRINVAGMTRQNMEPLCQAIAKILN